MGVAKTHIAHSLGSTDWDPIHLASTHPWRRPFTLIAHVRRDFHHVVIRASLLSHGQKHEVRVAMLAHVVGDVVHFPVRVPVVEKSLRHRLAVYGHIVPHGAHHLVIAATATLEIGAIVSITLHGHLKVPRGQRGGSVSRDQLGARDALQSGIKIAMQCLSYHYKTSAKEQ